MPSTKEPGSVVKLRAVKPEAQKETESAIQHSLGELREFIAEHEKGLQYFVMAMGVKSEGETAFHVFTSPIDVANFALVLKLLDNTFANNLQ